ncbi:DEDD exonuclease domain-containing protein [Sciscionella sediminilitoris]|uniref:DEDD exonuclease domain-containing protein n=1 Tax=Sciscionella sediminilitoris TaxID=1445613 RepID=UPI0004DF023D|nr:DEDD exonuclease domain-containing protein [Sciscionella sp. SE31]
MGQLSFDELGTPLRETTFCVFDLETTGGAAGTDAITEIGAVKVRGGEVLGEFATLVDPGRGIPPQVVALTGITDAMVCRAPRIDVVLPAFLEFAEGSVLVAHNAQFDLGFLRAACAAQEYPWPKPASLCTVRLARRVLSPAEAPSCKLSALARLFGAATEPNHRALSDARATVDVLHGLLERVGNLGVQSLEELLGYLPKVTEKQRRKRTLARDLPHAPGVYLFRGPGDEVLYVGTARDLRNRVRQYFTASETRARLREMVALAKRVDWVECAHPLEARVRELRLITAHKPAYNRRSRNQHGAWWLTFTEEAFPRLSVVRRPRADAFGPFPSRAKAETAAAVLAEATGLRTCTTRIPARGAHGSPCAAFELGRCAAPCAGHESTERYREHHLACRAVLRGADSSALDPLAARLGELAEARRFEEAATRRDRLASVLAALDSAQRLVALTAIEELVAAAPDGSGGWEFAVIRHGRLANAGTAPRGVAPMPVVEALLVSAETVLAGEDPLHGAPREEALALLGWLESDGVRLVRTSRPWCSPSGAAGSWRGFVTKARAAH